MIFSILAFITLFISICLKNRKKSLQVQTINCMFESLYAFSISAYTAAILGIINVIRSSLFIRKDKFSNKIYLSLLLLFEGIIIINCTMTWEGIISLLPTMGSIVRTYCLWQSEMKYIRFSGIISGIFFGMYYIYYQSWFMVAGYFLLLVISLFEVCKEDVASLKKQIHSFTN